MNRTERRAFLREARRRARVLGGLEIGPARECLSTACECECPTFEFPDGSRGTIHPEGCEDFGRI